MMKVLTLVGLLSLVAASPAVVRTREEIEAFKTYLESTRTGDGSIIARSKFSNLANTEELSGKFQGDILLDDWMVDSLVQQYALGRNAYTWPNTKWPNNTVVWEYGDDGVLDDSQRRAMDAAIADIESHTCIRFRKREPGEAVFVQVTAQNDGCYAHVGYWQNRGAHIYNLSPHVVGWGCFRHATIVHEWLHILGFFHMHSTHNRDDYVRIVEEYIDPANLNAFRLYTPDLVDNLGLEYDYVSCLQYSAYAFSINGQRTIVALQEHEGTMGQRVYITDKDWLRLNRHYNCPGAWD